jgi:hypothetical protein
MAYELGKVRLIRRTTPGPASVEDITPKTKRQKQKRRSPEGKAAFCLIVTRKEELLCPWQAWQRPTLPGLKP